MNVLLLQVANFHPHRVNEDAGFGVRIVDVVLVNQELDLVPGPLLKAEWVWCHRVFLLTVRQRERGGPVPIGNVGAVAVLRDVAVNSDELHLDILILVGEVWHVLIPHDEVVLEVFEECRRVKGQCGILECLHKTKPGPRGSIGLPARLPTDHFGHWVPTALS